MAPRRISVFISYARKDGADLAQRLERDLAAQGFDPWLDTQRLSGGVSWTNDIEGAIDKAQVVLALLSPGSYASEICRAEHLRSLRKGKRVIPLLAAADSDIPLYLEPKQYRDFTGKDLYPSQLKLLLADIAGDAAVVLRDEYRATRLTYVTAPPTVASYIERPKAMRTLRDALFADGQRQPIALTALAGMGGIGKTVLAKALTQDEVVQQAFPDGIVWITVGRESNYDPVSTFHRIGRGLGEDWERLKDPMACEDEYRTAMAKKAALVVVDDVWKKSDLDPFLAESKRSQLLFTTRAAAIAKFVGAREHIAELLPVEQARELLATWAGLVQPQIDVGEALVAAQPTERERTGRPQGPPLRQTAVGSLIDAVIKECGNLPLALSIVGAMLRDASPENGRTRFNCCARPISRESPSSFLQARKASSAPWR
jgi:hypothetical protein